ncbi:MAG TPA: RodZ domain-containing protein [Candidatus Limnocylindria bacterium]|nr:RodZ domain-containing protein [Candidatus Limnocylindria bacterium]
MTATELHKLGEVLRGAREAKGVDLPRVERDTKIRVRYLAALESGTYRELPGAVYTKGFLRNYGLYLGLDPEYLIDLYRLESSAAQPDRRREPAPPRPITARRSRAFVLTPGAVAAAILTIAVIAFVYYLGRELITFARTPELRVTDPAGAVSAYHELMYTVRGVAPPNSRITVKGLTENPTVTADDDGNFSIDVKLVPGSNVITLIASDPLTKRDSDPESRTIQVVVAQPSQTPGPQLTLAEPADEASLGGTVKVSGSAGPGATLTVTPRLIDAGKAGFKVVDGSNRAIKLPAPKAPAALSLTAAADGAFSGSLQLAPGTWELTVAPQGGQPVVRRVTVTAAKSLSGGVAIEEAPSYLEVREDGKPKSGVSGGISQPGDTIKLKAKNEIRLRAGNAAAVDVTINGVHIGPMGGSGAVVDWTITLDR